MRISKSERMAEKAEKAIVSAMEIYNKPDSPYREEGFAILALNAWELLIKAKLLHEAHNNEQVLRIYEPRTLKTGKRSTRLYLRRNRAGNPHTIGLFKAITDLEKDHGIGLDSALRANLEALVEIRDNAVHFINAGPRLAQRVLEVGTAAVRNFMECARLWFDRRMDGYAMYLLPIGFVGPTGAVGTVHVGADEQRLVEYLGELAASHATSTSGFHAALEVAVSLKRSIVGSGAQVQITKDPAAPAVQLADEDVTKLYPWDYRELTRRLGERYVDFCANQRYHDIRKDLKADPRYVKVRLLDPAKPKGLRKEFFNPNIVDAFDKHYTRK